MIIATIIFGAILILIGLYLFPRGMVNDCTHEWIIGAMVLSIGIALICMGVEQLT